MTHNLHLVSDSTGETVSSIVRSVMSQFEDIETNEHVWALVRTRGQMEKVTAQIEKNPGMVLYTIIDPALQDMLLEKCEALGVPCIPVLSRVIREMSTFFGASAKALPGRQHELDEEYFERVEAINFTLAHDDGQSPDTIDKADIIIVGVSRTSKTPTCVYLSYRGVKVANVPFVQNCPLPERLFDKSRNSPFVVGLIISPDRLMHIRKSRLISLNEDSDTSYADMDAIKSEVQEARRLYSKHKWPVIDVTRRSVEETAATIMQKYNEFTKKGSL